jgi:hypothetical protein
MLGTSKSLSEMTTDLLASTDGSCRSDRDALGERCAKGHNFGGCSETQFELRFGWSRKRDRAGSQARIDSCSWQGRSSSCRNQNSFRSSGCLCENGRCGVNRHVGGKSKYWRVRSATLKGRGSLSSLLRAPLLSSFDASTSPFVVDCTISLTHEAMHLRDSGGSDKRCRMNTRRRVHTRLVRTAWEARSGTSSGNCGGGYSKDFGQ